MIKRDSIDKVLDIAKVDDIVGDAVQLKRRGANLIGLCPFHNEKTPSFVVSPAKGIFKCFGCGESGNSVGFLMKHDNMSFQESIRALAERYNIEIEETQATEEEKQLRDERESLYIANTFAQQYYSSILNESEEGKTIGLSYFKERGYTGQTIEKFGLGYALDGFQNFYDYALGKQYSKEVLLKNGLLSEKNDRVFDFFRARVMFPIQNVSGKVVAFAGRTLSSDKKVPKYVNTAETDIYHKSRILYGMYQAKNSIRKKDNCFVTEGYTDVISLHQAGIENVVASSGTALTEDQVRIVKRFTQNLTLLFDGDAAGIKAAMRGVDIILKQDLNVRIVALPEGEDPDSLVKQLGVSEFENYLTEHSKDFILFKTDFLLGDQRKDPAKRAEVTREIVQSITLIPDAIKRSFYIKECSELLSIEEQLLHYEINKLLSTKRSKSYGYSSSDVKPLHQKEHNELRKLKESQELVSKDKSYEVERELMRVLLEFGHMDIRDNQGETCLVSQYILDDIQDVQLENHFYNTVLNEYKNASDGDESLTAESLLRSENEVVVNTVIDLTNTPYELSSNWADKHEIFVNRDREAEYAKEVIWALDRFNLQGATKMLQEREEKLKICEDEDEAMTLLTEIQNIKARVKQYTDSQNLNLTIH